MHYQQILHYRYHLLTSGVYLVNNGSVVGVTVVVVVAEVVSGPRHAVQKGSACTSAYVPGNGVHCQLSLIVSVRSHYTLVTVW